MAPENPRALYIFESTAHGNNHWRDMWEAAMADEHSSRCIFVGWWSHDLQRIPQTDRRFKRFGTAPPTPEETERIVAVKRLYDFDISMEQLAWYRMEMTRPNSGETDMAQNQPYTADEAFVQSGVSFFGPKRVQARIDEIRSAPVGGVEDGGFGYKVYEFYLADEYHLCRVEALTQDIRTERIKLRVWEYPNPEGVYVIGCDPAGDAVSCPIITVAAYGECSRTRWFRLPSGLMASPRLAIAPGFWLTSPGNTKTVGSTSI